MSVIFFFLSSFSFFQQSRFSILPPSLFFSCSGHEAGGSTSLDFFLFFGLTFSTCLLPLIVHFGIVCAVCAAWPCSLCCLKDRTISRHRLGLQQAEEASTPSCDVSKHRQLLAESGKPGSNRKVPAMAMALSRSCVCSGACPLTQYMSRVEYG